MSRPQISGPGADAPGAARDTSDVPGAGRSEPWIDYLDLAASADARPRSWKRLPDLLLECLRLVWSTDRKIFILNSSLQLFTGIVAAAQIFVIKVVLEVILSSQRSGASVAGAVLPIVLLGLVTAFTSTSSVVMAQQSRLLSELTTRATWERILDVAGAVDLLAFEASAFYNQLRRVQANAATSPYLIVQGVTNLLGGIAGTIGVAAAIVAIQPVLLPLLLLSGIPLWFSGRRASRAEFHFTVDQNEPTRRRGYLSAVLTGRSEAKELRAFGLVPSMRERYDSVYASYIGDLRSHLWRKTRIAFAGTLSATLLLAATLLLLLYLVSIHQVGLAEAGAALVAIRMLGSQIAALFGGLQRVFESSLFMEDLRRFLALQPGLEAAQDGVSAPPGFDRLEVSDVRFRYPGATSSALRGVSLSIAAGEVVAVVGENGSGKTTLAKLLAGLYEPDGGRVYWDGVDVREFERRSLRRAVAIVFQDFVRYQLTAAENIGAGQPELMDDLDGVTAAARQAGAHEFLVRLPRGYETLLSRMFKGGMDLSGGQWQRIALARAFYRDAPFVILDEPTASLDPRAEADLFDKIRELLAGRTVLLISHRFSSVRYADAIYVMKDGEIVEHGTHDELMACGGLYAELFTLQAAAYVDSPTT